MPGTHDITGLKLEVWHRVGAGAVREQEVAVHLVRLRADCLATDEHIADPHCVREGSRERALVDDIARAVRLLVLDEDPLLEELLALSEEYPEKFGAAPG